MKWFLDRKSHNMQLTGKASQANEIWRKKMKVFDWFLAADLA